MWVVKVISFEVNVANGFEEISCFYSEKPIESNRYSIDEMSSYTGSKKSVVYDYHCLLKSQQFIILF